MNSKKYSDQNLFKVNSIEKSKLQTTDLIILQITNSSASDVSNFDIFNAQHLKEEFDVCWNVDRSFSFNNVTIRSLTNNSYRQILTTIQEHPFSAGSIFLESKNGPKRQVTDVYGLTSEDEADQLHNRKIKPYKYAYEADKGIAFNCIPFLMGPSSKISWKTIYALAAFQLTLFSEEITNPSAALTNMNVQAKQSRPCIIGNLRGIGSNGYKNPMH